MRSVMMRMSMTQDLQGYLFRFFMARWSEVAYIRLGLSGLQLEIEFPSDWYEERAGWVRIGIGFMKIGVAFPWPWVSKDDYQCSGHTYGFVMLTYTGTTAAFSMSSGDHASPPFAHSAISFFERKLVAYASATSGLSVK